MKKIISEKYIRKTLRNLLLESGGAPAVTAARTALEVYKNKFDSKMLNAFYDVSIARNTMFLLLTGGPGGNDPGNFLAKLKGFEKAFIDYLNALDGGSKYKATGANSTEVIFNNLVKSIDGKMSLPLTSPADMSKINKAIIEATEAGTGIGTYDDQIEMALTGADGAPKLAHVLDMIHLNKRYNSDARKFLNFRSPGRGNDDMYASLAAPSVALGLGGGDLNTGEMIDHVIRPLLEFNEFIKFTNSSGEPVEAKITGIYQAFYDNIPSALLRKGGVATKSGSKAKTSGPITTTTTTTSGGPITSGGSGGSFGAAQGNITIDNRVIPIIPKGVKPGFDVDNIINVDDFKSALVKRIRSDARSLPTSQVYQLEVSWSRKKGVDNQIQMNLTPVGVHRVVLKGRLGGKFKKSEFWDGSMREIFADAFNNSIFPSIKKTNSPYSNVERFRVTITFDSGYYNPTMYDKKITESSKKILIKGKDILKIVSPLKLKR